MDFDQDRLVTYYMDETNKRLERIEDKLEILVEHKAMLLGKAKATSFGIALVTSAIVGGLEWIFRK